MVKLPPNPPAVLSYTKNSLTEYDRILWRILRTAGSHALAWNELRHWGPRPESRFEPHPSGTPRVHKDAAVTYAARDVYTAFGQAFIDTRVIDRTDGEPVIAAWEPTRPLILLDLTTRHVTATFGAPSMQMTDDRAVTQAWARALYQQHGTDIDGIYSQSSIDNGKVLTLFPRATSSFPKLPSFHELLTSSVTDALVHDAAKRLGFGAL